MKRLLFKCNLGVVAIVAMSFLCWSSLDASPSYETNILHSFTGGSSLGIGNLTLSVSDSKIYGTSWLGGNGGVGTIFQINPDGTGFQVLHNFTGGTNDGANPFGSLTLSGSTLYGATMSGGTSGAGTIFKISTDGSGYQIIYSFTGGVSDGAAPYGSLTLSNTVLYGATASGGANAIGTLFRINTDGTEFQLLHSFSGDGASPHTSLAVSDSTVYGMTQNGGAGGAGTIFKIGTDGTQFQVLHTFTGGASDGGLPRGALTLSGSLLYGMTRRGGTFGRGTIFEIDTSGTGFKLLHSFDGSTTDGSSPQDSLVLSGSTLYGMTRGGGEFHAGTIFKINSNGTGFQLLHSFTGTASDWGSPNGSLTLSGSTLWGLTLPGDGTLPTTAAIFQVNTDGSGFQLLHRFAGITNDGAYPQDSLTLVGSSVYGMTPFGGTDGGGTIFRVGKDGTGFRLLHSFSGGANDGLYPQGSLSASGSTLYGMTGYGGTNGNGTIFRINEDGTGFQLLHSFEGSDGNNPQGSLVVSATALYGMVTWGENDNGTVFRINTDGTGFQVLHRFEGGNTDGSTPFASLILVDSTLYGTTAYGGTSDAGTIFEIQTDGSGFGLIHSFTGGKDDGLYPNGSLSIRESALYGMTPYGGANDNGAIFKINTDGTDFELIHSFSHGSSFFQVLPSGSLTVSDSIIYGMARLEGDDSAGAVFQINVDGTDFRLLHVFSGGSGDGYYPQGSLTLSGSTIFGMTPFGGTDGVGVIFSLMSVIDSDGDGLGDQEEIDIYGTDPQVFDTDGDGLGDGAEVGIPGYDADPSTVTDPLNPDSDGDGYFDGNNGVDPCEDCNNSGSTEADETNPAAPDAFIHLVGGWNLFSYPDDVKPAHATCTGLADLFGGFSIVESIERLNPATGQFDRCDESGGVDFPIVTGEAYVIRSLTEVSLAWPWSPDCPVRGLEPGMHLIGHPAPTSLTCFDWLEAQPPGTVASIQGFDPISGRFLSCSLLEQNGTGPHMVGENFPIRAAQGYLFHTAGSGNVVYPGCP